jgi:hypothetical protein
MLLFRAQRRGRLRLVSSQRFAIFHAFFPCIADSTPLGKNPNMDDSFREPSIIQHPSTPRTRGLRLDTKQGNAIVNQQSFEIPNFERAQFRDLQTRFNAMQVRTDPTPIFNCHGLTFAARRTCISDSAEIAKILKEDAYMEIPADEVLPGDVIIYHSENGDYEHSGVVVESPAQSESLKIPRVVSKWGKYCEVLHFANHCPYNYPGARYYRIKP